MSKIYYELDAETGELKETTDKLVALNEGDRVQRKEQLEYCRTQYQAQEDNGNFVWLLFKYGETLFPDLSAANLTRLIYASTFCGADGSIMSKNTLREQMGLNRARWSEFWNEVTENNILYEKDDVVFVNPDMVQNGVIKTDDNYTRLFCEYIQQLYEECGSANDHKQLSYIFKIIPFINRRTNIACKNPTEQNESNIQPLLLGDLCELVGYSRKNARRLAKDLLQTRINGELAVGFFVMDMNEEKWMIVVNPKIYFGGKYDALFKRYRNLFIQEAKEHNKLLGEMDDEI